MYALLTQCTTFFVMEERQESHSLLIIHVALQDGYAYCIMIIGLVCLPRGLLVPGLWCNSVVVFS
jgi:hypothetical protein